MSASKEERLEKRPESSMKTLGIIAGGGALPEKLVHACDKKGIVPFIVAFENQTDPGIVQGHNYMWTRLGAAGQVISTLKAHDIHDLVLIGSIRRPSLAEILPDLKTAEFFAKVGLKALGDNDFLGIMRKELEKEGFKIHGIHKFAEDLLAGEGVIGKYKPKKGDRADIERGIEISQKIGVLDVGQSVVVQEGIVLGVEAAEGTDQLIRRCTHLKRKGRGGVLVKTCKPQQDRDFDLPAIGPDTVRNAAEAGLAGIAVHAGFTLLIDPQGVAEIADQNKMFVVGVDPSKFSSQ